MAWDTKTSETMLIDGVSLEYRCFGPSPEEAVTLVLLHEGLGCVALWRDFPEQLAKRTGLGVLVYSRQGYGQSDPVTLPRPLDFQTREALDVLPRVLDHMGIGRCILLGHSDGATISAIYAGSVEDHRIRGLILMAPHFFTEEMGLAQIAEAREKFESSDWKDRLARFHKDPVGAFRGWSDVWLDPAYKDWNVADVIDYIRVPILAIQGREDEYGTLAQVSEIETRAYSPVDTVILDCKHQPHFEASEQTFEAIEEYCERLLRIEAAQIELA